MKFDLYGVLIMNCSYHYFDHVEFILCSKLSTILKANVAILACFALLTFLMHNKKSAVVA